MKGKSIVISVDGEITITEHDSPIALEALQGAVGGYIETIPYFYRYGGTPCLAFCNEEAQLINGAVPMNSLATKLWQLQFPTSDYIAGPVIIVQGDKEFMSEL